MMWLTLVFKVTNISKSIKYSLQGESFSSYRRQRRTVSIRLVICNLLSSLTSRNSGCYRMRMIPHWITHLPETIFCICAPSDSFSKSCFNTGKKRICFVGGIGRTIIFHMSHCVHFLRYADNIFALYFFPKLLLELCCKFQADDNLVSSLSHALRNVGEKVLKSSPKELPLEYFSSVNFIGMFVGEACAAFLKDTTNLFSAEVKRFGLLLYLPI